MHRSSARNRRRNRRSYINSEDVNPMNYLANLSDVMLILAVGIMLALILHWNVEIETTDVENQAEDAVTFSEDDLKSQENLPENMEKKGDVYYDAESGTYYIVEGGDSQ